MSKLLPLAIAALFVTGACSKDEEKKAKRPKVAKVDPGANKKTPETPKADPEILRRGEYLAAISGCVLCHTAVGPTGPIMDKAYAGGLEVPEKFGTWISPNITQHEETGIGKWTDDEIIASIREGVRPDGSKLLPLMPYMFYNKMSDDDAKALVTFLRMLPKVDNKIKRNDLPLPHVPVPKAEGKAPGDEPVAQGEYLTSLMHCVMCHTPMDEKGPVMAKAWQGGFEFDIPMFGEGKLYSTNITQAKKTGLGDWTDEQILAAIKEMKKKDGSMINPPMAMYQQGWFGLTETDGNNIVAFLRTIPAVENKVPKSTFKAKPMGGPPPGADKGGADKGKGGADKGGDKKIPTKK